ncbi:hypothetical protein [Shimazuella kribbensis]|nr:hypothetical protein [Shimazuella kribbensis]
MLGFFIQKWYNITDNSGGVSMLESDPPGYLGDPEGKNGGDPT